MEEHLGAIRRVSAGLDTTAETVTPSLFTGLVP